MHAFDAINARVPA